MIIVALGDLLYGGPDPTTLGLPPMQEQNPLRCAVNQGVNCSRQGTFDMTFADGLRSHI